MNILTEAFQDELLALSKMAAEQSRYEKLKAKAKGVGRAAASDVKGIGRGMKERAKAFRSGRESGKVKGDWTPGGIVGQTAHGLRHTAEGLGRAAAGGAGAVLGGLGYAAGKAAQGAGTAAGYVGEKASEAAKSPYGKAALGAGVLALLGRKAMKAL